MGLCFHANPSNSKMLALTHREKGLTKISHFAKKQTAIIVAGVFHGFHRYFPLFVHLHFCGSKHSLSISLGA